MSLLKYGNLLGLVLLIVIVVTNAQNYDDYDDDRPLRPAPPRIGKPSYSGQSSGPKPTPVPILKQINRHNEDGSYTYGYEGADGSFKIETKEATGEVKGKYGYVDDTGKVRVVEYGATKYGFAPAGEGITVPPPTLVDESSNRKEEAADEDYYYEQRPAAVARPLPRPRPRPRPQIEYEQPQPQPQQQFVPAARPAPLPRPQNSGAPASFQSDLDFGPKPRGGAPVLRPAPQNFAFAQPAPIEEPQQEYAPAPRPAPPQRPPKITYAHPAPLRPVPQQDFPIAAAPSRPIPRPQFAPRPSSHRPSGGGGVLDQLAKDYALPQGGAAPLHDISFGYY